MDSSKQVSAWLESAAGERTPIQGSCFLGRASSCEVVLLDNKVSRQHALVQGQELGDFFLIDLGSANGTYVNGRRVGQPHRLVNGDQITVAGVTFTFRRPGDVSRPAAALPAKDATIPEVRTLSCWLLLADIEGSTQLMRKMAPNDAHRTTGQWLAACTKLVNEHHGTINKFLGDGFLAYWPEEPEVVTRVASALGALKEVQDKASTPFRVVLHYGQVFAGGLASLGEESLAGPEVNFLFRAEKLAASLGRSRLLTQPAQNQIQHVIETVPEGNHGLAGFSGEFPFFSF
jgi:adenylate cyclase